MAPQDINYFVVGDKVTPTPVLWTGDRLPAWCTSKVGTVLATSFFESSAAKRYQMLEVSWKPDYKTSPFWHRGPNGGLLVVAGNLALCDDDGNVIEVPNCG